MKHKRSLMSIAVATVVLLSLCAVCASTNVTAAQGNSANVQTPALVGAPVAGALAVCSLNASNLDLFVNGTDGALWWKHWDSQTYYSAWTSLGGHLTSDPAAVHSALGMYVFGRGADGALWAKKTTNGGVSWSNWYEIGGRLLPGTGPAAYAWGNSTNGRIGWLVTGMDHALWHTWNDSAGHHDWESIGGYLTSSPAATSRGYGLIDVSGRGADGALWQSEYTLKSIKGNEWSVWTTLGGKIAPGTGPAACSWVGSQSFNLDVFVQGMNGALYHNYYAGGTWSGWESLGGKLTSSPAAATIPTVNNFRSIQVYVRGGNGDIWERFYDSGLWSPWLTFGGM